MWNLPANTPIIISRIASKAPFILVFSVFQLFANCLGGQTLTALDILNQTFNKISTIQTLTYHMEYKERNLDNGKIKNDSTAVKYQKYPRRVYIKVSNSAELLWGPDINGGDILVHPPSFPFFNLNLNPNGFFIRKTQHHSIDETGFEAFEKLVKAAITRAGNDINSHFFYQGEVVYHGYHCQEILIIDPGFKYIPYTVKEGEDIISISHSLCVNAYMILKHNPKVSTYTDVKAGDVILVPTNYGMKVQVYIDKGLQLPVMMRVEDEKGLFEEYDYTHFIFNPGFKPDELTKDYKDYHF